MTEIGKHKLRLRVVCVKGRENLVRYIVQRFSFDLGGPLD